MDFCFLTIITFIIAICLGISQGKILNEVEKISVETNEKISSFLKIEGLKINNVNLSNSQRIKVPINLEWSFYTKLTLYKVGNENSYIFDIGDSFVKNRMSLYLDEYGFLNWRIIDNNYKIHILRKDFNDFIADEKRIVLVKNQSNYKFYTSATEYVEMNLSNSNISIDSNDFYLGSDMNGENKFISEKEAEIIKKN